MFLRCYWSFLKQNCLPQCFYEGCRFSNLHWNRCPSLTYTQGGLCCGGPQLHIGISGACKTFPDKTLFCKLEMFSEKCHLTVIIAKEQCFWGAVAEPKTYVKSSVNPFLFAFNLKLCWQHCSIDQLHGSLNHGLTEHALGNCYQSSKEWY